MRRFPRKVHRAAAAGGAACRRWLFALLVLAFASPALLDAGAAWAQSGCADAYKGLVRIRLVAERKPVAPASLRAEVVAGNGTGFAVRSDDGDIFIVTAAHVVKEPENFLSGNRPNYELVIEAKDCSEQDVPIKLEIVRSGYEPEAGEAELDVAVLKMKNEDEEFDELEPIWLAWIPAVPDSIPITVYGFPKFDRQGMGKSEREISISPGRWAADGPEATHLARLSAQLSPGMSGAPIRDAATGHVVGIAATRQINNDGSGALLFRSAVRDFVERHANLKMQEYHSVMQSLERVLVNFARMRGLPPQVNSLLDRELPAIAGEFKALADASDDNSTLRWFVKTAEAMEQSPPPGLLYEDVSFFTSSVDAEATTKRLDVLLESEPQLAQRLKRSLLVTVYVEGSVVGSDSGTMSFTPHVWYIFDTGKVLARKLDAWTIRLVKNPDAALSAQPVAREPGWDYPLGRLTVAKALLYRLIRSHLVDATIEAEMFCTLIHFGEAAERARRSSLYAMMLKFYSASIRTVGADALPISLFAPAYECPDPEDDGKILMAALHRQTSPPLTVQLNLYDAGEDGKLIDFYGRLAWSVEEWPRRKTIPRLFNSFGENASDTSCDSADDKHDFCQLRYVLIEELNALIYDE